MSDTEKATFASVLAETQDKHRKSDLSNLAHAHTLVKRSISEANALIAEIEELAAKIDSSEEPIPEGLVAKLYARASR